MKLNSKILAAAAGALVVGAVAWRVAGGGSGAEKPVETRQARPVPVTQGMVTAGEIPLYLGGIGTVRAYNTVTIQARVDGQLESVDFREGQDVKEGDRLAQIDPKPFQATLDSALANLAKDEANLANARRDLARYQDTAPKGYSTKQQLDTQSSTVNALTATIQGDRAAVESAQVQLGYTTITAPIAGRTGIRRIDRGNIVHAADTGGLVVITQLEPISVIFTLPQDALPKVAAAQADAAPLVIAESRDGAMELGQGVLELVDNQIDPATGTIRLKARFPNANHALWPGEFVNARIRTGIVHDGVVVDSRVVQRGPNGVYAYAINADDIVEVRPIETGPELRGQTLITKGLKPGERVVVDGQLRLEAGVKVSTSASGGPTAMTGKTGE